MHTGFNTYKMDSDIKKLKPKQLQNELLLCRGCLKTGRMYDMFKCGLAESYLLLGLEISKADGLSQHLCQMCTAFLIKYSTFRDKCRRAKQYLESVCKGQIKETSSIEFIPQYTISKIVLHSYLPEDTKVDVKIDKNDIDDNDIKVKNDITRNDNNDENDYCDSKLKQDDDWDVKENNDDNVIVNDDSYHNRNFCDVKDLIRLDCKEIKSDFNTIIFESVNTGNDYDSKIKIREEKRLVKEVISKSKLPRTKKQMFNLSKEEGRQAFAKKYNLDIEIMSEEERRMDVIEKYTANNSLVKCSLCFKALENEETLKTHMKDKHDASKPEWCSYCGYRTSTKRALQYHTVRNHKYKFTCLSCGLLIRTPTAIAEHYRTHSGQTLTCPFCGLSCKKSKHYRLHLKRDHPSKLTWCGICGEVYINIENHLKASHKETLKTHLQCTICKKYFMNQKALDKHNLLIKDENCGGGKSCVHCGLDFQTEDLLKDHFVEKHKKATQKLPPEKRLKTKDPSSKHDGKNGGVCDVCGKIIFSRQGMKNHRLIHSGEKPHSCADCGKKFRNKMSLANHSRTHSGERPFSCEQCQKRFSSQSGLYRHRRVHTGEKRHKCDICAKYYSSSSTLKSHLRAVHMKMPTQNK